MRMRRDAARAAISAGMTVSRNCSNGLLSRKKNDSLVVIASTTSTVSGLGVGAFELGDQPREIEQAVLARDRHQPAFGEVVLLRRQHQAGAGFQHLAQEIVVRRGHGFAPRNMRVTFGAI